MECHTTAMRDLDGRTCRNAASKAEMAAFDGELIGDGA